MKSHLFALLILYSALELHGEQTPSITQDKPQFEIQHLFEVGEPFYFKYGTKPSYGCNAGLVRIPDEATEGRETLLFSTLDNPGKGRVKMTVWASLDGTKTWPVKRLVYPGPCAYSSLPC